MGNKVKYVVSKVPGLTIGTRGATSTMLDEGEKIRAREVNEAVVEGLEEGDPVYTNVAELIELDPESEAEREKELAEKLAESQRGGDEDEEGDGEEIEAPAFDPASGPPEPGVAPGGDDPEDTGTPDYDPSEHKVDEVLEYLRGLDDPEEIEAVKTAEAASDRASTRIAAFEPSAS